MDINAFLSAKNAETKTINSMTLIGVSSDILSDRMGCNMKLFEKRDRSEKEVEEWMKNHTIEDMKELLLARYVEGEDVSELLDLINEMEDRVYNTNYRETSGKYAVKGSAA